jgi:hypothetical protein
MYDILSRNMNSELMIVVYVHFRAVGLQTKSLTFGGCYTCRCCESSCHHLGISQLIAESIDHEIHISIMTACCGAWRLCGAAVWISCVRLPTNFGSISSEHQHQHSNIVRSPTATRHRRVSNPLKAQAIA